MKKTQVKVLHGDTASNIEKGVGYAKRGDQAKILNSKGEVVFVIGGGACSFEDDRPKGKDTFLDSKTSAWFD